MKKNHYSFRALHWWEGSLTEGLEMPSESLYPTLVPPNMSVCTPPYWASPTSIISLSIPTTFDLAPLSATNSNVNQINNMSSIILNQLVIRPGKVPR